MQVKIKILFLSLMFVSTLSYGAASKQGCDSSGDTAAGCNILGGDGGNATVTNNNWNTSNNSNVNSNINQNDNSNVNQNDNLNINRNTNAQGQSQSTSNSNNANQTVNIQGDKFEAAKNPVNTAVAPFIAPTANCALGVSGGVQTLGFGMSFGKSYIDENCTKLEKIRSVSQVLGDKATAEAMMCEDKVYRKAREKVGRPCED